MANKYSWGELFFSEWQIIRRKSRGFWVRELRNGQYGLWVKISAAEIKLYSHLLGEGGKPEKMFSYPEAETEDWRGGFFCGKFKPAQSVVRITDQNVILKLEDQKTRLESESKSLDPCSAPKVDA